MLEQEAVRVTCSTGDTRCHTPGRTARQEQHWGGQTDPAAGVDVAMRAWAHIWIQGGQGKPHMPGGEPCSGDYLLPSPVLARLGPASSSTERRHRSARVGLHTGELHTCGCTRAWMCTHACVHVVCVPAGVHMGGRAWAYTRVCKFRQAGACTWVCTGRVYVHTGVQTCLCARGGMCVCAYNAFRWVCMCGCAWTCV